MDFVQPYVFKKSNGTPVLDTLAYIKQWESTHTCSEIHVGCDSKKRGDHVKYSVSICMRDVGNGVHELHHTEIVPFPKDHYTRLWQEVERVVKVAQWLRCNGRIFVHLDINNDPRYLSGRLFDASMGFVKAMGFEAIAKPDAWAASCGAHKYCQ